MAITKHIYLNNEIGLRTDKEENLSALIQGLLYNYYKEKDRKEITPQEASVLISKQIEAKLSETKKLEEEKRLLEHADEEKRLHDLEIFNKQELESIKRKEQAKIKIDIINEFGKTGKQGREEFELFIREKYPQDLSLFNI